MQRLLLLTVLLIATLWSIATAQVPKQSIVLHGIDSETVRSRLDATDLQPIEGIWHYAAEAVTVGIERYAGENNIGYRIILLESRDIDLLPGTVMGYIASTAVDNKYRLWMYCERNDTTLLHPVECIATTNQQATSITFKKTKWKIKFSVNLMRFLPTFFRGLSVTPYKEQETLPTGFNKVYPIDVNDKKTAKITYL